MQTPNEFVAAAIGNQQVNMCWSFPNDAADFAFVDIERSTDNGQNWTVIKTLGPEVAVSASSNGRAGMPYLRKTPISWQHRSSDPVWSSHPVVPGTSYLYRVVPKSPQNVRFPSVSVPVTANGRVRYVSATGNNAAAGTQAAPWRDVTYAVAQMTQPCDLIIVGSGTGTTWTQNEIVTAPGVSIHGQGRAATVLRFPSTGAFNSGGVRAVSLENDTARGQYRYEGAVRSYRRSVLSIQEFRGFTSDGNARANETGVCVINRSGVNVEDVSVKNHRRRGIYLGSEGFAVNRFFRMANCFGDESGWSNPSGYEGCFQIDGNARHVEYVGNDTLNFQGGYGTKWRHSFEGWKILFEPSSLQSIAGSEQVPNAEWIINARNYNFTQDAPGTATWGASDVGNIGHESYGISANGLHFGGFHMQCGLSLEFKNGPNFYSAYSYWITGLFHRAKHRNFIEMVPSNLVLENSYFGFDQILANGQPGCDVWAFESNPPNPNSTGGLVTENIHIRGNVFELFGRGPGIGFVNRRPTARNIYVYNNTFSDTGNTSWPVFVQDRQNGYALGSAYIAQNNVFDTTGNIRMAAYVDSSSNWSATDITAGLTGWAFRNNVFRGQLSSSNASIEKTNNVQLTPQFVGTGNRPLPFFEAAAGGNLVSGGSLSGIPAAPVPFAPVNAAMRGYSPQTAPQGGSGGNQAPVVSVQPLPATVQAGQNIVVQYSASDPDGSIASAQLIVNGSPSGGADTTAPFDTFTLNAPAAGQYSIAVRVTDNQGLSTTSTAQNVTVQGQNQAPSVMLLAPTTVIAGNAGIQLSANPTDPDGNIAKVEFFEGAVKLGERLTAPWVLSVPAANAANRTFFARVTDAGNLTSDSLTRTVQVIAATTGAGTLVHLRSRNVGVGDGAATAFGRSYLAHDPATVESGLSASSDPNTLAFDPPVAPADRGVFANFFFATASVPLVFNETVPNGQYGVSLLMFEDNNPASFNIKVEGQDVALSYQLPGGGGAGKWAETGPFWANVTDGTLRIEVSGGEGNVAGYSIYSIASGGNPVAPGPDAVQLPKLGYWRVGGNLFFTKYRKGSGTVTDVPPGLGGGGGNVDILAMLATLADYQNDVPEKLIHTLLLKQILASLESKILGGVAPAYDTLLELYNYVNSVDAENDGIVAGLLAALAGKADAGHVHTFAQITEKPTTLTGYGITDAYTEAEADSLFERQAHTRTFASEWAYPLLVSEPLQLPASGGMFTRVDITPFDAGAINADRTYPSTVGEGKNRFYLLCNQSWGVLSVSGQFFLQPKEECLYFRNNSDTGTMWVRIGQMLGDRTGSFDITTPNVISLRGFAGGRITGYASVNGNNALPLVIEGFRLGMNVELQLRRSISPAFAKPITLPADAIMEPDSLPAVLPAGDSAETRYLLTIRSPNSFGGGPNDSRPVFRLVRIGDATRQGQTPAPTARQRFYAFNDFVSTTGNHEWSLSVAGTGAEFATAAGVAGALGVLQTTLGTTATGRCTCMSTSTDNIVFGSGLARYRQRFRPLVLSTPTDTYTVRMGFINSGTAEPTNGAFFRYTDGLNGGRWQAVVRISGSEIVADTGVAATVSALSIFEIVVNNPSGGSVAYFSINGVLVATLTASVSAGMGYGFSVIRTLGTATMNNMTQTDYAEVEYQFNNPR
jgi:hypothetical protein